ncbi:MAG: hypothetical protein ACKOAU_00370 [Pirellula sp.]
MQDRSSQECEPRKELERLQVALAQRLVYPDRSVDTTNAVLVSLDRQELDRAAETLVRKRISQTRGILPQTVRQLGNDYRRLFREYASCHHYDGHRAILLDGAGFADWLLVRLANSPPTQSDTQGLVDALRWERELCLARLSRFRVRRIRVGQNVRWVFRFGKYLRFW